MRKTRLATFLLAGAFTAITPLTALASTAPCTEISNIAGVTYAVGGVDQTNGGLSPVVSPAATFNVGAKILVDVARVGSPEVTITPGGAVAALKFTVTNNSNNALKFVLTQSDAATGTDSPFSALRDDSFDLSAYTIYVDDGDGNFETAQDTATTSIASLAGDGGVAGTKTVFIAYDPATLTEPNAAISVNYLMAQAQWLDGTAIVAGDPITLTDDKAGAGSSCDAGTPVAVVIDDQDGPGTGDGADDAADSDAHAYIVDSAKIGVVKDYTVLSDPINGAVPGAKAIPGAVIRYSIEISNTGGASAILSTIEDTLASTLQIVATADSAAWEVTGTTTRTTTTDTLTPDTGDANTDGLGHADTSAVGGKLTATLATILPAIDDLLDDTKDYAAGELKAGEKVTIYFNATIQ